MGEETGIRWTHHTFNPWIGCTAVSRACDLCYAKTLVEGRMGGDFAERRRTSAANWSQVRRWNRKAREAGERRRVFVASLADVFDNKVPVEWRRDLWALIRECDWLDFMLLTKRPMNIRGMLPDDWQRRGDGKYQPHYPNVWLGTTVEDQEQAELRLTHLLSVQAAQHFMSGEPLLARVNLTRIEHKVSGLTLNALNGYYAPAPGMGIKAFAEALAKLPGGQPSGARLTLVIVGGEADDRREAKPRPMHPEWVMDLLHQCSHWTREGWRVAFFFKQWGSWGLEDPTRRTEPHALAIDGTLYTMADLAEGGARRGEAIRAGHDTGGRLHTVYRVGKVKAGNQIAGRVWEQMPLPEAA